MTFVTRDGAITHRITGDTSGDGDNQSQVRDSDYQQNMSYNRHCCNECLAKHCKEEMSQMLLIYRPRNSCVKISVSFHVFEAR